MSARPCVAHTHDRYFPKVNYWEASPPAPRREKNKSSVVAYATLSSWALSRHEGPVEGPAATPV